MVFGKKKKVENNEVIVNIPSTNDFTVDGNLYDAIIVISSFNRVYKLKRLIDQITTQETRYKFKIIVLNDCSEENYDEISKIKDIVVIKNESYNGKENYWKSITKLFTEASKYNTKAILQLDDDFIICDNFLNKVLSLFNKKVEEGNYVAVYFHIIEGLKVGKWNLGDNWIDGGGIYDYEFLKSINFSIDPISEKRWKENESLSSGVWQQMSNKINNAKKLIQHTDTSLVIHDGNEDSKMNTKERKLNPIITKK